VNCSTRQTQLENALKVAGKILDQVCGCPNYFGRVRWKKCSELCTDEIDETTAVACWCDHLLEAALEGRGDKVNLYIGMVDAWGPNCMVENCGVSVPPSIRIVEIPLSPEQIEQLQPRKVGTNAGRDIYETPQLLCIQLD